MATYDEILGGSPKGGTPPPKGSQEWLEQQQGGPTPAKGTAEWADAHSGANAPAPTIATPAPKPAPAPSVTPAPQSQEQQTEQPVSSYEDLIKQFMPKPKTQEELDKEAKKYRRKQIINAIGEGVTALSNLFFTTQYAPNMYKAKDNSIDRTKVSYDKMLSDNKSNALAYLNAVMGARKADDARADAQRNWERQLERDRIGDERYNANIEYRAERDRIGDERYNQEQAYRRERDAAGDAWRQKQFDENKRQADRNYNFQVKQHNDNVDVRRKAAAATAARGVRGKRLGFSDGDGNQVSIYENVWKGSMQQVYDAMLADGVGKGDLTDTRYRRKMDGMSASEKDDFVKQNWHKSQRASQIMLALSKIDPASMTSEVNDEVEDYTPNEEVIDYVPGN